MRAMMLLLVVTLRAGCAARPGDRPVPARCMEYAGCAMQHGLT